MATITKLPSGSYRIRRTYKGRTYSVTVPYKPRKAEADQLIAEVIKDAPQPRRETLAECCEEYLRTKSNVLSPATIRAYRAYLRNAPPRLLNARITDLNRSTLQSYVNDLAGLKSPKSVRNYWGFFRAVIQLYTGQTFSLTMPQKEKPTFYVPEDEDVKRILNYLRGNRYEVPITLAALGLRRSEIAALTLADLSDDDILTIDKALVQDARDDWVLKSTKTTESTRQIPVPHYIAERIREQGYIYKGHPGGISKALVRAQRELGIERFSLHKLRHYFASQSAAMHIPDIQTMRLGGWKSPSIMRKVYTHAQERQMREESKKMMKHISRMRDKTVTDSDAQI